MRSEHGSIKRVVAVATLTAVSGTSIGQDADVRWLPDPAQVIREVADQVIREYPEPVEFNWGEGVLMAGMMRAGVVLDEPRYVEYVRKWADHWQQAGISPVLEARGYSGHWGAGLPIMMLFDETGDVRYLAMAQQIVDYMQNKATRTPDGGLGHWQDNRQLWVDTLYMCCPVYVRLGRELGKPAYVGEAARQLGVFARHNQDAGSGLFRHTYDQPSDKTVGVLWGRGNGWTLMSYIEVLRRLDPESGDYKALLPSFRRLVIATLKAQDEKTGLWHTVMDKPETYLETSASAMLLYSLAQADRTKLIELDDRGVLRRAWVSLAGKVDAEGRVIDVSAGTGPGEPEAYATKERGSFHWGTGAFLLAASTLIQAEGEWVELFNGKDLAGWKAMAQPNEWVVAGGVEAVAPPEGDQHGTLKIAPGSGVLVNGAKGKTCNVYTSRQFGSCEAHIEFSVPRGSNSGIYFMGKYEIQVLDSWGKKEVEFSDCGGIYARWIDNQNVDGHPPRVNASRAPGEWQSFDVVFEGPRFDPSTGKKTSNPRFVKVIHNGKVVHENVELKGPTRAHMPGDEQPRGPIMLQGDHGPVAYRNIRIRPLP